jgi:isopenicillin N synthase-like dioxygenase
MRTDPDTGGDSSGADADASVAFVPVVDISGFTWGAPDDRAAVVQTVARACERSGFLVLVGHSVDPGVVEAMRRETLAFFALPDEEKLAMVPGPGQPNGYRPLQSSSLAASLGTDTPPDLCEFFSMVRPGGGPGAGTRSGAGADPNRWPPAPPGFAEAWTAYYHELEQLAGVVMRIFALALDLEEDWFVDKIDDHCSALFANHYPGQDTDPLPGQLRLGEHTDFGSVTLLQQDDAPGGIEVRDPAGSWRPVPHIPGAFVVNLGDLMARWTNDRWVSTLHRVVNPPAERRGEARLSIPFFHQPNADALIECIPTCATEENPPRYAPVRSGEWRDAKVAASRY